jgi:hypothetical protein
MSGHATVILAQIGLFAPDAGAALVVLMGSIVVFVLGGVLLAAGIRARRLLNRRAFIAAGLLLVGTALGFWGLAGFFGAPVKDALHHWRPPTRRSWDLSAGHEAARLGEKREVPANLAFGGRLDFTIALPGGRRLAGPSRFVAVDTRSGSVQRLKWIDRTDDPCALARRVLTDLQLPDRDLASCSERIARADRNDILRPAWTVRTAEPDAPRFALRILPSPVRSGGQGWTVEATVLWDPQLWDDAFH